MIGFETLSRRSSLSVVSSSFAMRSNPGRLFAALVDQLQLIDLELLNVADAVADAPAESQKRRPLAKPPPALQCSGTDIPPPGQLDLIQMPNGYRPGVDSGGCRRIAAAKASCASHGPSPRWARWCEVAPAIPKNFALILAASGRQEDAQLGNSR